MQPARFHRFLSWAPAAILAGAFVVCLTLVAGCVQVGDRLTGVDLSRGRPTTCIKQCNDQYKQLYDDEQKAHLEAKALCVAVDCSKLPRAQRRACLDQRQACQAAEEARHNAAMADLSQRKVDCQNHCHHQGGGSAG